MAKKNLNYHEQKNIKYTIQLREFLEVLPPYAKDYFRARETSTSPRTRIAYAYDLRVFFQFLIKKIPSLNKKKISEISLQDLNQLTSTDMEEYQEFLKFYEAENGEQANSPISISRKLSALRSFLNYFFKKGLLLSNAAMQIEMPKVHEKAIIHLEPKEVAFLLNSIETFGDTLAGQKKIYFEKTKTRDLAIITLLLGTGIRVSECVGLNLYDINFIENSLKIIRKGGNESILYFGTEVEQALTKYIKGSRKEMEEKALPTEKNALFFSMQKKRISVHAVENLVEKYTQEFIPQKRITPHKLRSTFGTTLYQETGDIYLVADVLGHSDVGTTKKHYAALKEEQRRAAAAVIKLRD